MYRVGVGGLTETKQSETRQNTPRSNEDDADLFYYVHFSLKHDRETNQVELSYNFDPKLFQQNNFPTIMRAIG